MPSPKLALYHYEGCPYCSMVRDSVDRLGLDVELRDILRHGEYQDELLAATGRRMVPCLRIEEGSGAVRWMHESRDIIDYLEAL